MYLEIMETSGTAFARGLSLLGDAENCPAIVHCTSGKDRTGMFVLLLHLILGVSLNDALVEYQQESIGGEIAVPDWLAPHGCDHGAQANIGAGSVAA